jgi:two-component system OmpR family response regulator
MRILLVEDDARTASFVAKGLTEENHNVTRVSDGEAGLLAILSRSYDAAVVDIMLPGLDGTSLVKRARSAGVETPVLFLSARSLVEDRVAGLTAGGDDYVTKPFAFAELVARLDALWRRSKRQPDARVLRVADLEVDTHRRRIRRGETEIVLQPLELALLEYLMRNAGRVVTKTMIMEHVWDYNFDPQTNVVETRICRLREKVDKAFEPKLIHTVRGCGYVMDERA